MRIEATGTVTQIDDTQAFASGFTKRQFVIALPKTGNYQDHLALCVHKDRCALLDDVKIGDVVEVWASVKSNAWKDRWFTEAQCYKLTVTPSRSVEPDSQPGDQFADVMPPDTQAVPDDEDMPF